MRPTTSPTQVRYRALLQILRTADSLWNASRLFFAQWKLSPSQFNLLNLLSDQPEGLPQIELGRNLIMHRSNVTGLVDRLEKRGLVVRADAAHDRRVYHVKLTGAGRDLVNEILPAYHRLADRVWESTPVSQAQVLADHLTKLGNKAGSILTPKESD